MRRSPCHRKQRHRRPASIRAQHVKIPSGRWELSRSLQHAPPVVYRSVIRSCASENQVRQQVRQHFSHWGDGKFAGVAGTYISLIEPNINAKRKMRFDLGMSAIFPSGRWEVCRRGWHVHIPDRTKYQSKTKDESRFGHVSHLPSGQRELLKFQAQMARTPYW